MKIALIRKKFSFHGGAEKYVSSLLNELMKQGHDITIFCSKWEQHQNLIFKKVPLIKINSFFSLLSFAFFSRLKVKQDDFDVIHSFEKTIKQDVYRAGDGCHIEFLKKRFKNMSILRKLSIIFNPFHIATLLIEKHIFNSTKHFIAISETGKKEIIQNYKVPAEKITVIYNGVDSSKYSPENKKHYKTAIRKKFHIAENDFLMLFVGSGFTRKGLPVLIDALKNEMINKPSVKLLVAGKEKKIKKYKKIVKKMQLENRVIFCGPQKNIEQIYAAGDLLVMPALYEPFGNVALEAMATGIPVIASQNCGASEIIEENLNGFVIDSDNPSHSIAKSTATIMKDTDKFNKNSRKTAKKYSLSKNAAETIAIYTKLS